MTTRTPQSLADWERVLMFIALAAPAIDKEEGDTAKAFEAVTGWDRGRVQAAFFEASRRGMITQGEDKN